MPIAHRWQRAACMAHTHGYYHFTCINLSTNVLSIMCSKHAYVQELCCTEQRCEREIICLIYVHRYSCHTLILAFTMWCNVMSRCVAIKKVANTPIGPDSEDYIFCVKDERSGKDNRKQSHMHSHMMCNTFYIVRATSLKLKWQQPLVSLSLLTTASWYGTKSKQQST